MPHNHPDFANRSATARPPPVTRVGCAGCGAAVQGEPIGLHPAKRRPCPRCGSTMRAFAVYADPPPSAG